MTIIQFPDDGGDDDDLLPVVQDKRDRHPPRSKAELRELRRSLWEDRIQGKPYHVIAKERGIPMRTVIYNCQAAVREIDATAMLEEEMALSLSQLNEIQRVTWSGFADGDTDDREAWYKAYDRKMKLLGLEAPKRIDVHAEIIAWAEREGLDPADVIDVTASLLPVPKPPSYST